MFLLLNIFGGEIWALECRKVCAFSASSVAKARAGLYTQFEVQRGLPITSLLAQFRQGGDEGEGEGDGEGEGW